MRRIRSQTRPLQLVLAAVLCCFALLSVGASAVEDWRPAAGQKTVFLPFKILAPAGEQKQIERLADRRLDAILKRNQLQSYPRDLAAPLLNGPWPPPPRLLAPVLGKLGLRWVAVGSITRIGRSLSIDLVLHSLTGEPSRSWYRTVASANELADALQYLVGEVLASTGRYPLVRSVAVEGNSRIDTGAILRHVSTQVGDRYDEKRLREDIKAIYRMGYFDDVRVYAGRAEDGKRVVFQVKEKAIINQVSITGTDELKEKEVREVVTVAPNTIVNERKVKESAAAIRRLYKEKGFSHTTVTSRITKVQNGRVNVEFAIKEGKKLYITSIVFQGNKAFDDDDLKEVIETSEKGFFSWLTESGILRRDVLEQDAARLAAFYHNHGFVDARVGTPEVRERKDGLEVIFPVAEGRRYKVGAVRLDGDLIEPAAKLLAGLALPRQEAFSRKVLHDDITRLTDFYANRGYAYADVLPRIDKDEAAGVVNVTLRIEKNMLVHVNRIVIKGNTRTRDKVIRRQMRIKEQEIFNAAALRKSSKRLRRLDYFEDVQISPEPAAGDDLLDIVVRVKEKPTGTFSIGAGYSSVDDFMFMGEISQDNFMGKGQRLALQADISGSGTRYNFSFTEPNLSDSDLLFGVDLYKWSREYDDYTKDSTGFALRFGHPLWNRWYLSWSYGYDHTNLTDLDYANLSSAIRDSLDINVTSYVRVGLSRDTRNHRYAPTKGSIHAVELKYAGGPLGGDSWFTKVKGSTSWYFPFFWKTTLHLKAAAGFVTENTGGELPVYEKFYLGGMNTIRGFKNGQISPRDPLTGDRIGGAKMWFINEEIIFPLLEENGLLGVVFLDAGNVYDTSDNWDFSRLKRSVGLGLRWLSPLGPLRLEWGYNLDPVGDEDRSNWDFSIGGSF